MKRHNVLLTDKQDDKIKKEALDQGIRFSEMMRKIVDWFFEYKKNTGGEK